MIFVFPKRSEIFGQLDVVLRDVVPAIGGLLEVLASRGLLKIYLNNIRQFTKGLSDNMKNNIVPR